MPNKKETNVDSILAAAGAKMGVKEPPTGTPPQEPQFDMAEAPITGPIDFGSMKPVIMNTGAISKELLKPGQIIPFPNDDAKFGKAFQIATKTFKKYRATKVEEFIELVNEIKSNL
jgi:hypothetical protein